MGLVIFIIIIHIFVGIKTQETLSVHKKFKHKSTSLFCRKSEAEAAFQTEPVFCFFFSKE